MTGERVITLQEFDDVSPEAPGYSAAFGGPVQFVPVAAPSGAPAFGYIKLQAGVRCRCIKLMLGADGFYYCCRGGARR